MTTEQFKNFMFSVCVGLCVTFIGHLAEGVIAWLQHLNLEATGGSVGGLTYLAKSFKRTA